MKRRVDLVLGISNSHDSGVAIIREGEVLAAVNEERFTRKKQAGGFPRRCLEEIWQIAGVNSQDIDAVAVAGTALGTPPQNNDFSHDDGHFGFAQRIAEALDRSPGGSHLLANELANSLYRGLMSRASHLQMANLEKKIRDFGMTAPIMSFEHHDAHVASAYYASGDPDCLVISNDGFGDGLCSKVALAERSGEALRTISANYFFNSLGTYYNYVTHFCGFMKGHHAGKTTGLAAYGDPAKTLGIFQSLIEWDESRGIYVNRGKLFRNCLQDVHNRLAGYSREDAAAGIQKHCEDILTKMVNHYMCKTGRRKIALVGGVHANVKVNQRIAEITDIEKIFVFPNMGDGGLALGAAYLAWAKSNPGAALPKDLRSVYLGPGYSDSHIADYLSLSNIPFQKPDNMALVVAYHLQAEKIVARFDGRMEYGPRALGNRSILYPATNQKVNDWLNRQLRRTEFMPFAPAIREDDVADFFVGVDERTSHTAEFMTITYDVTERCKIEAPATVHVDGTARPQIIRREVNPRYYDILTEYKKLTGLSVLVNTSFNMHEEPIVCTPQDAVKAFYDSNLDVLAIGPFIIVNDKK